MRGRVEERGRREREEVRMDGRKEAGGREENAEGGEKGRGVRVEERG